MTKTLAIFGATGAQGSAVVREALSQKLSVRAVARDVEKIAKMHPGASAFGATLEDEAAIAKALDGVDAAFFHLPMPSGPNDAQIWLTSFINAAKSVDLPLLVYTTSGPAGLRYARSAIVDNTTAGRDAVANCGIPAIILQPAIYLENLIPDLFAPNLRSKGILDYPPMPATTKVQWTSHLDQAVIAVAALQRSDLAGNSYELGTPDALSGPDLAELIEGWIGRSVEFEPITPAQFGQRVEKVMGSPSIGFALSDLYGSLAKLDGDDMAVDISVVEKTFGVKLASVADHIKNWPKS
ncbi:hypothetical protein MNBD_ALPHA11-250 [hydrothermal vent metagenome]|uniref:NmrA-like domain-containing protein n=1 Tax=hydrothermal vent metagenome TaxID=652676 RepID=A0A3B0TR04_9ZZZZ